MSTLAWHFVGDTLLDGRPIPADGEWLVHTGKVIPCKQGLHASIEPFDALRYAPGTTLCRVEVRGMIAYHENNKLAASERRIIARFDASQLLSYFARKQALSCTDNWQGTPPDEVLDWLTTGNPSARKAAKTTAWRVSWSAAEATARLAARSAAETTEALAAWSATESAAWSVAESAGWAAKSAAALAVSAGTLSAGRAASAADTAASAARAAAGSAARKELNALVHEHCGFLSI